MKNKFICALCSILAAALLSGCGMIAINSPTSTEAQTENTEETESSYQISEYPPYSKNYSVESRTFLRDVTKRDYGGAVFRIASPKAGEPLPDETTGAVISEAFNTRVNYLQDYYNVSISSKYVLADTMLSDMSIAMKAGDYYADMVLVPQNYLLSYVTGGYLMNLNTLPDLNLEADYFSNTGVEAGGGNGKIFAVGGEASITLDALSCIFVNKDIVAAAGLEMPYSMADDGSWTWDAFKTYCAAAANTGKYSFGAQNTQIYLTDLIYFSCGGRFITSTGGIMPTSCMDAASADAIVGLAQSIYADPLYYRDSMTAIEAFNSGNLMFLIDNADTMELLANSPVDWGILPLPKYTAEQAGYYTLVSNADALMAGVPITVTDTTRTSDIFKLWHIISYGIIGDAHAENAMNYYLRDNASARMLDRVIDGATYDFAYSYSAYSEAIASVSFTAVRNPAAGMSTTTGYLNTWTNAFNNAMYRLFG